MHPGCTRLARCRGKEFRSRAAPDRAGDRTTRDPLLQGVQKPGACDRRGARNCWVDARLRQVKRLLPGDDLCGFSGGGKLDRDSAKGLSMQDSLNSACLREKRPRRKLDPKKYAIVRTRVLERDGWRCKECGSMESLQVHHMKPRSRLGGDVMQNLITLCVGCHGKCHGGRR